MSLDVKKALSAHFGKPVTSLQKVGTWVIEAELERGELPPSGAEVQRTLEQASPGHRAVVRVHRAGLSRVVTLHIDLYRRE